MRVTAGGSEMFVRVCVRGGVCVKVSEHGKHYRFTL